VLDRILAFTRIFGAELENIRRGAIHSHRQGTKVMHAGNLHLARIDRFQNAGQERQSDAMAQLGIFEAEFADFPEHGAPVGVPVRIPAGRERIHNKKAECSIRPHPAWRIQQGTIKGPRNARSAWLRIARLSSCGGAARSAFQMPMIADFLQSAFAIDLLFQSPQRFVDRFALF